MQLTLNKIPKELAERPQWVLWKNEDRDGKPTKLPYMATHKMAKSNDPETWATLACCQSAYEGGGFAGVGYVFAESDPFVGVDLDGCRNPETREVAEWAKNLIVKLDTYGEVSPSETGVKLWLVGKNPLGDKGRKIILRDEPKVCDKTPAIEIYDRLRFFAVTGWRLRGPTSPEASELALDWLAKTYFADSEVSTNGVEWRSEAAVMDRARKYLAKMPPAVSGQHGHDKAFHAACVLVLGFGLHEGEALTLMQEWNQTCQPAWSDHDLRRKVSEASKQPGERNYLRNTKPENWDKKPIPVYTPIRTTKAEPPQPEPKMSTLAVAAKLYADKLIAGEQNLISLGIGELDYALSGGVEQGEMIVLAARPSHGKSAVALQCCHHWSKLDMPCLIISEEMSALALGKRTLQFICDLPEEHWRTKCNEVHKAIAEYSTTHQRTIIAESCGTVEKTLEMIDKAVKEQGVKAVVVDYAQQLRSPGKSRYEQVTHTSIAIKQAAARHGIIVLLLCQLNRAIESRPKFTPVMSDIKETGQLEQDADVILFLVWPHRINSEEPAHEYKIYVAKNRNRATNQQVVTCKFNASRQMITESAPPRIKAFDDFNREPQEDGYADREGAF